MCHFFIRNKKSGIKKRLSEKTEHFGAIKARIDGIIYTTLPVFLWHFLVISKNKSYEQKAK